MNGFRRIARGKSGQTMIFLVMVLVILTFIVLWNFDLHKTLFVKQLSQNAGDSAAMAAARWQGVSLNIMGDLNIMHAVALTEFLSGSGSAAASDAITELQARLCYAGPMMGMMASQQAAKNNRIHQNEEFTEFLRDHVNTILYDYPLFVTEAYPGCLTEYADMLAVICDNGVAAGPESMLLYSDYIGDHMLLNPDFYDAIATREWCWFFFNAYELLCTYSGYGDWPPLPLIVTPEPINSEFFSLRLRKASFALDGAELAGVMGDIKEERDLSGADPDASLLGEETASWYCYDSTWGQPFAMSDPSFPSAGTVKPQYDYAGADAAVRVESVPDMKTPGTASGKISWSAAAKPFGYLGDDGKPGEYGIVLPSFHDVRMIPLDASSSPGGGGFNLAFRKHCEEHLPAYVASGTGGLSPACWYCQQLMRWEDPGFRAEGVAWLSVNSALCTVSGGGGGGGGGSGGTRRGH